MVTTLTVEESTLERFNSLKERLNSELPDSRTEYNSDALLHELIDEYEGVSVEAFESQMREIAREEINDNVNPRALE